MAKKKTSFYLDEEVLITLKKIAKKNNRSQSNMIEQLITDYAKPVEIKNLVIPLTRSKK
jgi:predicted transcriptional regulator